MNVENKIPLEPMEVAHIIELLESQNSSLYNHIEFMKRSSFKRTSTLISGNEEIIVANNVIIDKLNSLLLLLSGDT